MAPKKVWWWVLMSLGEALNWEERVARIERNYCTECEVCCWFDAAPLDGEALIKVGTNVDKSVWMYPNATLREGLCLKAETKPYAALVPEDEGEVEVVSLKPLMRNLYQVPRSLGKERYMVVESESEVFSVACPGHRGDCTIRSVGSMVIVQCPSMEFPRATFGTRGASECVVKKSDGAFRLELTTLLHECYDGEVTLEKERTYTISIVLGALKTYEQRLFYSLTVGGPIVTIGPQYGFSATNFNEKLEKNVELKADPTTSSGQTAFDYTLNFAEAGLDGVIGIKMVEWNFCVRKSGEQGSRKCNEPERVVEDGCPEEVHNKISPMQVWGDYLVRINEPTTLMIEVSTTTTLRLCADSVRRLRRTANEVVIPPVKRSLAHSYWYVPSGYVDQRSDTTSIPWHEILLVGVLGLVVLVIVWFYWKRRVHPPTTKRIKQRSSLHQYRRK